MSLFFNWRKVVQKMFEKKPEQWQGPICVVCGQPVRDYIHRNKKYCSRLCKNAARRERERERKDG
jgi:hypothetical protein